MLAKICFLLTKISEPLKIVFHHFEMFYSWREQLRLKMQTLPINFGIILHLTNGSINFWVWATHFVRRRGAKRLVNCDNCYREIDSSNHLVPQIRSSIWLTGEVPSLMKKNFIYPRTWHVICIWSITWENPHSTVGKFGGWDGQNSRRQFFGHIAL